MSRLAVEGGEPLRAKPWPSWPIFDSTEEQALLDVLHSGQWWSVGGKHGPAFEEEFAAFQQAKYAVSCTNGTAALEIALRALGIGCGDEVIVPPYTFIATASSVLAVSATPIFVDIEPDSFNIDPARIEDAITPRTKAIIPVHIAGCPANMSAIMEIARKHGLLVIEDAAQAVAAAWEGTRVGAIGNCGTFSFQASKNLNAGEGGILISNDEETADKIWSVVNVGRTRSGKWYEHNVLGGNFRLTEWQAAILRTQLKRVPEQTARRSENACRLGMRLQSIPGISPLQVDRRVTTHANHLFIFRYAPEEFGGRSHEEFVQALTEEGVPAGGGYVPLYREHVFQRKASNAGAWCQAGRQINYLEFAERCPVCEEVCKDTVWLQQHLLLGEAKDMDDIADAIEKIRGAWSA